MVTLYSTSQSVAPQDKLVYESINGLSSIVLFIVPHIQYFNKSFPTRLTTGFAFPSRQCHGTLRDRPGERVGDVDGHAAGHGDAHLVAPGADDGHHLYWTRYHQTEGPLDINYAPREETIKMEHDLSWDISGTNRLKMIRCFGDWGWQWWKVVKSSQNDLCSLVVISDPIFFPLDITENFDVLKKRLQTQHMVPPKKKCGFSRFPKNILIFFSWTFSFYKKSGFFLTQKTVRSDRTWKIAKHLSWPCCRMSLRAHCMGSQVCPAACWMIPQCLGNWRDEFLTHVGFNLIQPYFFKERFF